MTGLAVAVLALLVVLVWPVRRARAGVLWAGVLRARVRPGEAERPSGGLRQVWQEDPVELWRLRRRVAGGEPLERALLALLDGTAAALRAGLPPARALELGGLTLPLESPSLMREFVERAVDVSSRGLSVAPVWRELADRVPSAVVHGVAAAWGLSESTGCPLAEAVERATAQLRSALAARRKVRAAVAGPQATVTVLTVLPLTGPVFGLACGVSPGQLYGNAVGLSCLGGGLALMWLGRLWCRRLIRRAERPT